MLYSNRSPVRLVSRTALVVLAAGSCASLLAPRPARAADISWLNATSGNWSSPARWAGGVVPSGAGNTATIDATGALYTVTLDSDRTLDAFTLNSTDATFTASGRNFTITGASSITAGAVQWFGSNWAGSLNVGVAGSLLSRGSSSYNGLSNTGSITVQGVSGSHASASIGDSWTNDGTLTFTSTVVANANMTVNGNGVFTNNGTVNVNQGAGGNRSYNWHLANSATGTFNVGADASFDRGNAVHANNGAFNVLANRTLSLSGNAQTFNQSGGTLTVDPTGAFVVSSNTFNFSGGIIAGQVTITNSTLNLSTANTGSFYFRGSSAITGDISANQTYLERGESGTHAHTGAADSFTNAGTMTFTSTVVANSNMTVNGGGVLTNTGTINVNQGAGGSRSYNWHFNNTTGTVNIDADASFDRGNAVHNNSGTFNILTGRTFSLSGNAQTFNQNAGTLNIQGGFNVDSNTFNFNGGTMNGTPRLTNSTLNIGTTNAGSFHLRGSSAVSGNVSGAQSVLLRGESGLHASLVAADSFTSAGHLTFTSTVNANANMTVSGGGVLTNTGSIDVLAGSGGGRSYNWHLNNSGGTVNIDANASFDRGNGVHTNAGTFNILAGRSLTISGNAQTFNQNAGLLDIDGTFDIVSNTFNFNGGTMTGTPRLTHSTLNIGGTSDGTILTRGSGAMSGDIAAGQTVLVRGESGLHTSIVAATSFTNRGTLTFDSIVNANANMTINFVPGGFGGSFLFNKGTLNINAGAGGQRSYSWRLNNTGVVNIDANATFDRSGGSYFNYGDFNILSGRNLSINGNNQTFTQHDGTLDADGSLDIVSNVFYFAGGTITGLVRLTNSTLAIDYGFDRSGAVVLRGDSTITGGLVYPSQILQIRGESALHANVTSTISLTNTGTMTLDSLVNAQANLVVNDGRVLENSGTFSIIQGAGGARNVIAELHNSGTFSTNALAGVGFAGAAHVNSGVLQITSNATTITGATITNQLGGIVKGGGILNVTAQGATGLLNQGEIDPGLSVGQLRINGNLTQAATGAIGIEIGAIGSNDNLQVTGAAALNGTIRVSLLGSYLPNIGDTFRVLDYNSRTGSFLGAVTVAGAPVQWEVLYSSAFASIRVTQIPTPGAAGLAVLSLLVAARRRR